VVFDTPPTTWGDLIGLASMVAHEAGHDLDALGARRTNDGDPGPKAAKMLALAVLRLHASAVPKLVPVDLELVRLTSEWRRQRDIVDGTCIAGEGCGRSYEESKQAQAIVSKAMDAACDLARQIWERAKPETWSGGPVNPLTLAVLAEIAFHHENGTMNTLIEAGRPLHEREGTRRAYGGRALSCAQRWRWVRSPPHGRPLLASCPAEGRMRS
jgi:hypothetical protein